jgi:hypothetical protein
MVRRRLLRLAVGGGLVVLEPGVVRRLAVDGIVILRVAQETAGARLTTSYRDCPP